MHTFDIGDKVTVFNQTMGGRFIVEGRAVIKGYTSDVDEQYFVKFEKERGLISRFVDPAGQADPEAFVKMLNESTKQTV